jgi:Tol biopolymer transport system component
MIGGQTRIHAALVVSAILISAGSSGTSTSARPAVPRVGSAVSDAAPALGGPTMHPPQAASGPTSHEPAAVRSPLSSVANDPVSAPSVPAVRTLPAITGAARAGPPRVGQRLAVTPGSWAGTAIRYSYRWRRCTGHRCRDIRGATRRGYLLTAADTGHRVLARVSASSFGGSSVADSAASDVVLGAGALGDVQLISSASDGTPANHQSGAPLLSPDGTRVAFTSWATNLVARTDSYGPMRLFVKDLRSGAVTMAYSGGVIIDVMWSPDGSRIAFSVSRNLAAEFPMQALVIDLATGATTSVDSVDFGGSGVRSTRAVSWSPGGATLAISLSTSANVYTAPTAVNGYLVQLKTGAVTALNSDAGDNAQSGASWGAAWSPDGTMVAFEWLPAVPWQSNTSSVYVKNLTTGALMLASSTARGVSGNRVSGAGFGLEWSPDGTRLMFQSDATNLVPNTPQDFDGIFTKNLATGELELVTTTRDGAPANGVAASFSPDGSQVAFLAGTANPVDPSTPTTEVFVKDLATGSVTLESSTPAGSPGNDSCEIGATPAWSPDGTRLLFQSMATNLIPNAPTVAGIANLFVKDLGTGTLKLVTSASDGTPQDVPSDDTMSGQWSPHGARILFASGATNLTPVGTDSQSIFMKTLPADI